MKAIFLTTVLFFSLSTFAQKPDKPRKVKPEFTPEQQAELQTKKLALALDLNEKQIKEIQTLETERAKARDANRMLRAERRQSSQRPTEEELFAKKSERLDAQAAHQKKMKKILTEEQYTNWKDMCKNKAQNKRNSRMGKSCDGKGPQKGNRPGKRNNPQGQN